MRRFLAISVALHAAFLAALVVAGSLGSRAPRYPPVYRINLVAAPRAETLKPERERRPRTPPEEAPAEEPRTDPEPDPPILEEEKEVVPDETATPAEPEKPRPEAEEEGPETETAPEDPPPETPAPEAGGNEAAMDLTVEGRPFPFPGYLERIVNKIGRNWRKTANRQPLAATVYFRVERSGRVSGIEVRESSGSFLFDQAALRAVEDASPLPPLPDGYTSDYLGVYFDFNEEQR